MPASSKRAAKRLLKTDKISRSPNGFPQPSPHPRLLFPLSQASPALRSILFRLGVFLAAFVIVSGILGPYIINIRSHLLYGYHFFIYGNLGKLLLYSVIVFFLLIRDKIALLSVKPDSIRKYWFFFPLALISFFLFFPVSDYLASTLPGHNYRHPLPLANLFHPAFLASHLILIAIPSFLAFGLFGPNLIRYIAAVFKKELLICLTISILFDLAIFQVWKLWPLFSHVVLVAVSAMFSLSFNTKVIPPRTLYVENFGVQIAEACSGTDSIFLFSSLYLIIAILDWQKLAAWKLLLLFPLAVAGLFTVNILRVYLIILIGVLWSADLALKLFHTYAGMILFILYFGLFMKLSYGWMKKSP